jgi:polyphenol oxidase
MKKIDLHEKLIIAYTEVADGNMDERFADRSVVMQNRRKFLNQFDLNPKLVIEGKQIGSDRVLILNEENTKMWFGVNIPGVDGFVTDQTDVGLLVKVADCVPVVMYDTVKHVIGLFHVGWTGAVKNIHQKGLQALMSNYGSDPADVMVWFGPSAHKCCFTSQEKPTQIDDPAWSGFITNEKGGWQVDLIGYIADTLNKLGIKKKNLTIDPQCTVESPEFFSHTRSKKDESPEGRFLVLAKLR